MRNSKILLSNFSMRKRLKKYEPEQNIIIFTGSFDQSNPHAKTVTFEATGGGKVTLSFPETEARKLLKLHEAGLDRAFTVIVDLDNAINVFDLIKEKEKFLQEIKLESGAFKDELQKLCPDVDVGKFSDQQIKALFYLGEVIEQKSDIDITGILNIPMAELKRWKTDIAFRRVHNALTEYNFHNSPAEVLKGIVRAATQSYGTQDRKLYAKMTNRLQDTPSVQVDVNMVRDVLDKNEKTVDNRLRTLGLKD